MRPLAAPALGLAVIVLGCARPPSPRPEAPPPRAAAEPFTLSILASNDVHGQLERLALLGGFVDNLRRARARDGAVLLVDAGDAFQGTIESNLNEGAAIIAAFNAMGYAAMALGNHEFDFGPAGPAPVPVSPGDDPQGALKERLVEARFPVLSANLRDDHGARPAWKNLSAGALVDVRGVKVGLVGLLTMDAPDVIKRPNFGGLAIAPLVDAAAGEAANLRRRGADVVVAVAHAGGACQRFDAPADLSSCDAESEIFRFARSLPAGAVDVIVGGHRNAGVAHVVAGIPIIHAPSNLLAFSRVDLVIDPASKRIVNRRVEPPHALCTHPEPAACTPGDYEGAAVTPSDAVRQAIAQPLDAARAIRARPVGVRVEAPFPVTKTGETALGNLFADLMREAVPGAEAAFGNAGSVRDALPAGELTFGQLHHVMPFDNQLAKIRMKGSELRALVRTNLTQAEHGQLSLSGVGVRASCEGQNLDVVVTHADGAAIRDDEELVVVTNDFLALGGDGLLPSVGVPHERVEISTGKTVLDALLEGLARRHSIRPDDPTLFDARRPRLRLPSPIPVRCPAGN